MNRRKKIDQGKLSRGKLIRGKLGRGKLGRGKLGRGKLGFSLLELSFVLIITSVLITAIAKGNQILKKTRIITAQSLTKASPVLRMSNLVVWYETTMDNSFSEADISSANINTWYNLNPAIKTNNATIGTAPTYVKNAINNLPALLFNNDRLSFNATSLANSDYTVIVVEQRSDNRDQNYFISCGVGSASNNNNPHLGYRTNTTMTFAQWGNDFDMAVSGFKSAAPVIHIFRFSSTLGKNYYFNGTNLLSASGSPATQGLLSYNQATIGYYAAANLFYYGYIGEIIIFNKYVNNDEMNDIKLYLSKKWKITVT